MTLDFCTASKRGVRLRIRVTPKSSCDEVIGVEQGPDGALLKAKVRAIADKGRANMALIKLLAGWVVLPQGEINLVSGHKSRFKTIEIRGDTERLMRRIDACMGELHIRKSQ